MIIITPDAAKELRALAASGSAAVLQFDADVASDGSYDCSVGLVDAVPADDSKVEVIDGISVVFRGMSESIFAGSIASILRYASEVDFSDGDVSLLTSQPEQDLIRKMVILPELVEIAASNL
ncbi:MAG TPA: hypothetical protein VHS28_05705, partial [Chloroflexota bacterium]|nr:hypothetical protein [Chloroflexota bacterium]